MDIFQNLAGRDTFTQEEMLQVLREYQGVLAGHQALLQELSVWKGVYEQYPPGHYYSPLPGEEAFEALKKQFEEQPPETIAEVDLRIETQLSWLKHFEPFYADHPVLETQTQPYRYFYKNNFFNYADALILYCMLRLLKPKRLIEVGSGFSSAQILDTNEFFCSRSIQCTFIEPYPDRLNSLLKPEDHSTCTILAKPVQEVPLNTFEALEAGDILFIDSSHVSKLKSDVNYLFFEVLPVLKSGVYIHIHDILYPFEYPPQWHEMGLHWNEPYLLRAFLANNNQYTIEIFNHYLYLFHRDALIHCSKEFTKGGGGSIWLKKQ